MQAHVEYETAKRHYAPVDCPGHADYVKIEMDRKGFETWKNMSSKERQSYVVQAKIVNDVYYERLLRESEDQMCSCVDEEADSAEVGKFDK
ncbi:hypothetical protein M8C21_006183, partial [Ambrosia artemisiifolia]